MIWLFFATVILADYENGSLTGSMYWLVNVCVLFYLVAYLVIYEYGVEGFLKKVKYIIGFVCVVSPFQIILGYSPFELLDFLGKSTEGVRFGTIRITGNWVVSNGYSMMLVMLLPLLCYDFEEKKINLWKNGAFLLLVMLNVILTGARLTVATFAITVFLAYFFQGNIAKKNIFLSSIAVIPIVLVILALCSDSAIIQAFLRTVLSAVDEVLNTSFAEIYGADKSVLANSTNYRAVLMEIAQNSDLFDLFHGKGSNYELKMKVSGFFVESIDNFYVELYMKYAIQGVVAFVLLGVVFMQGCLKECLKNKLMMAMLISMICYYISLFYLSHLLTFPIMMCIFAIEYGIFYQKR